MTKQELVNKIVEIINVCNKNLEKVDPEYLFYEDFHKLYNYKSIEGLLNIPTVDLASAILNAEIDEKDVFEVNDDILSFGAIFDVLDSSDIRNMNSIFTSFANTSKMQILKDIFRDTNSRRASKNIHTFLTEDIDDDDLELKHLVSIAYDCLVLLIENNGKPSFDVMRLISYYEDHRILTSNVVLLIGVLKDIKSNYDLEDGGKLPLKKLNERYKLEDIKKACGGIDLYRKILIDEKKHKESYFKDKLNAYNKFLKDIQAAFEKEEIINYESIINCIVDDSFKLEFLRLVYQHNKLYYDQLDVLYEELTKNSIVNYLTVLRSQNIKKDQVNLELIMRNSCEDVEKMLKVLSQIVDDKNTIIKILEISDLKTVNYIKELKNKSILTKKSFIMYPNIFDANSNEKKLLDRNVNFISTFKLNPNIFSKNPSLLIENDNLYMNLYTLKEYNLINSLKENYKYSFLAKDNLEILIDKIIELGYDSLLEKDLSLLNESNWDRIYVLKSMGLLPETKEELLKYLRSDKFFVSDKKLNLYIESTSNYYDDLANNYKVDIAKIIEEREINPRVLSFDGVIISKKRLLRNINCKNVGVNDLFMGLLHNSVLSMEEVETIKNNILEKTYKIG